MLASWLLMRAHDCAQRQGPLARVHASRSPRARLSIPQPISAVSGCPGELPGLGESQGRHARVKQVEVSLERGPAQIEVVQGRCRRDDQRLQELPFLQLPASPAAARCGRMRRKSAACIRSRALAAASLQPHSVQEQLEGRSSLKTMQVRMACATSRTRAARRRLGSVATRAARLPPAPLNPLPAAPRAARSRGGKGRRSFCTRPIGAQLSCGTEGWASVGRRLAGPVAHARRMQEALVELLRKRQRLVADPTAGAIGSGRSQARSMRQRGRAAAGSGLQPRQHSAAWACRAHLCASPSSLR